MINIDRDFFIRTKGIRIFENKREHSIKNMNKGNLITTKGIPISFQKYYYFGNMRGYKRIFGEFGGRMTQKG